MNYIKISENDIANGPGVRVVLWVSGCSHNCKGCHNPETHPFNAGKLFDPAAESYLFECLSKSWIQGITFSGGDPLEPENFASVHQLIRKIRDRFNDKKDIWIYTGYTLSIEQVKSFYKLKICDVIVDGPFIQDQRDISLPFCGSRNQRVIDVKQSFNQDKIVLYRNKY